MSAKGIQSVMDQEIPTNEVMIIAAMGVEIRNVANIHVAKRMWERIQVRRRVRLRIRRLESWRLRKFWDLEKLESWGPDGG